MKYFVSFALLACAAVVLVVRSGDETPVVDGAAAEQGAAADLEQPLELTAAAAPLHEASGKASAMAQEEIMQVTPSVAHAMELSSFGLFKIEVECDDYTGEQRCTPVPGTLAHEHPYWSYPMESLQAMPGDAVANHVLGIRLARKDPDLALEYVLRAVGLSGKPGSLVDFFNESAWNVSSENDLPSVENMKRSMVVLGTAEALGHSLSGADQYRKRLSQWITPEEMASINFAVQVLADYARSIEVSVEYQS